MQDADHRGISGQHTETNRCDYGSEKDYGHKKRIHGQPTFTKGCYQMHSAKIRIPGFFLFQPSESSI